MVQPWALALFKCAHYVQLWDKTGASAPVCIRLDYKAHKAQSGGAGVREQDQEGKEREIMPGREAPSQKSQGNGAVQTTWWLRKQAVHCVIKHQCQKTQLWAAGAVIGSAVFIPSVFLHHTLFDQTGRTAIFWSQPSDSCAQKCTSKFKWRTAPPAPYSFPRLSRSRFILWLINRMQLLTGLVLQNRKTFLLTSFSESGPRGVFFFQLSLSRHTLSEDAPCVSHLAICILFVRFLSKRQKHFLRTSLFFLPLRPRTSTSR